MAQGSTETSFREQSAAMGLASTEDAPAKGGLLIGMRALFGPLGEVLAKWRVLAGATPEALRERGSDRPYLDTIAFREVLPMLEEKHLLLSEIKELGRQGEQGDPERLACLEKTHADSLPTFLEDLERALMCVHSRRHHGIRDMLENIVLYDNFLNDFYLRNVCSTMEEAIEAVAREYR